MFCRVVTVEKGPVAFVAGVGLVNVVVAGRYTLSVIALGLALFTVSFVVVLVRVWKCCFVVIALLQETGAACKSHYVDEQEH